MRRSKKGGSVFNSYDIKTISSLLYTGGRISVSHNDTFFVSPCEKTVNFIEFNSGEVIHTLESFDHETLSLSISHDDRKLAVSIGNGDVYIYSIITNRILRTLHFSSPAVQLEFDPTSPLLALGFGNGVVRVYDVAQSQVIFTFGEHVGRIGMVRFHPKKWMLVSSSMNGMVISKDIKKKEEKPKNHRFRNHRGVVLGVCFVDDGKKMISTAVDKMFCVYDLESMELIKKFPVYEDVVGIQTIPKEWIVNNNNSSKLSEISTYYQNLPNLLVVAGSRKGNITLWDYQSQDAVWKYQPESKIEGDVPCFQFSHIIRSKNQVLFTTESCNFAIYSFHTNQPQAIVKSRQILGFDDEILDIARISNSHFATVTTGGDEIIIFNQNTKDCKMLAGHTDLVLSLASSPDQAFLVSGGKDRTIRVWYNFNINNKSSKSYSPFFRCCGVADSHTDAITSLSFSRDSSFFVSCSDDRTIKLYMINSIRLPLDSSDENIQPQPLSFSCQFFAHSKGVTDIDISPDGKLIATCSSDKNAKIFRIIRKKIRMNTSNDDDSEEEEGEEEEEEEDMRLEMTFVMNHPKGVWCIKFSSHEKVVATGGADHNIRIWAVETGLCIKLLEGHISSILKLDFVNYGTQMISASSNGVARLWIIKTSSVVKTWEAHRSSIWGMDVSREDGGRTILTCGEDCRILKWEENSEVVQTQTMQEKKEQAEKIQKLENLLRHGKFGEALVLTIELDQPRRTYRVLETMMSSGKMNVVDDILRSKLGFQEVNYLFQYCVDWNTNSRYCHVSHAVLNSFFRQFDPNFVGWNYEKSLDSILAYGNKHIKRLEKLIQSTFVMDYIVEQMNIVDEKKSDGNQQKKRKKKKKKEKKRKRRNDEDEDEEEESENKDDILEPSKKKRKL